MAAAEPIAATYREEKTMAVAITPESPPASRPLPTDIDVERANYMIGSYLSEIETMVRNTKAQFASACEDSLGLAMEGRAHEIPEMPDLDRDQLARLVCFATEALGDAETICEHALELRTQALALFHEAVDDLRDPGEWEAYQGRIAAWHREELQHREA
jgi:hypothetical protein